MPAQQRTEWFEELSGDDTAGEQYQLICSVYQILRYSTPACKSMAWSDQLTVCRRHAIAHRLKNLQVVNASASVAGEDGREGHGRYDCTDHVAGPLCRGPALSHPPLRTQRYQQARWPLRLRPSVPCAAMELREMHLSSVVYIETPPILPPWLDAVWCIPSKFGLP